MWNILYRSSPFLGKLLFFSPSTDVRSFPYIQAAVCISCIHIYICISVHIYTYIYNHILCYWFCRVINHAGVAACPSVTPGHLAEADGSPCPRGSRRQPAPLHKMKWPHSITGRKPLPEELRSGVGSSLLGSACPSAPARWRSGAQQRHFSFSRGWYGRKQAPAASFPCWFHLFLVALCLVMFVTGNWNTAAAQSSSDVGGQSNAHFRCVGLTHAPRNPHATLLILAEWKYTGLKQRGGGSSSVSLNNKGKEIRNGPNTLLVDYGHIFHTKSENHKPSGH